jgi:hypothetical protein
MVFVDGGTVDSPLMPALAQAADATFLCVQLDVSNRETLVAAVEKLYQIGGHVAGCITMAAAKETCVDDPK